MMPFQQQPQLIYQQLMLIKHPIPLASFSPRVSGSDIQVVKVVLNRIISVFYSSFSCFTSGPVTRGSHKPIVSTSTDNNINSSNFTENKHHSRHQVFMAKRYSPKCSEIIALPSEPVITTWVKTKLQRN